MLRNRGKLPRGYLQRLRKRASIVPPARLTGELTAQIGAVYQKQWFYCNRGLDTSCPRVEGMLHRHDEAGISAQQQKQLRKELPQICAPRDIYLTRDMGVMALRVLEWEVINGDKIRIDFTAILSQLTVERQRELWSLLTYLYETM
jgi:hypothetical protein